jgi:hypothetical protein
MNHPRILRLTFGLALASAGAALAQTAGGASASQHEIVPLARPDGRLSGDPTKPGAPFVIRLRNAANYDGGEAISGVISLQMTGAALRSSTFKNGVLELRMKIFMESFHFRASHKDGALVGEWSNDLGLKGSWHGKRVARGSR